MFRRLDANGRFHRDSPIGRMFHPGTVSYREISAHDSLHIAVTDENRLSVHVDRVSPLAIREGSPSRYSFFRVLHHNVAHCCDSLTRLWGHRQGDHRCQLDCEIVTVAGDVDGPVDGPMDGTVDPKSTPSRAPVMYEFSCKAAGAEGCGWKARATSEEELVAKVADHARTVHRVGALSNTLTRYAVTVARANQDTDERPPVAFL